MPKLRFTLVNKSFVLIFNTNKGDYVLRYGGLMSEGLSPITLEEQVCKRFMSIQFKNHLYSAIKPLSIRGTQFHGLDHIFIIIIIYVYSPYFP